ncbi:PREDICTED: mannan polymerase complex subunit mnn9-like [Branchiostoma belcheri]|uniref:Mannan polymerase complex subunit mnn9-like n=1 Tax=Branchiostoma belcheri TaxID=7741 RepID=A0A6P4YVL2_BRABE|nr:PREDICTED: mannan polymerase complex subunit mnn9-like [Branchiostoma belcheri]
MKNATLIIFILLAGNILTLFYVFSGKFSILGRYVTRGLANQRASPTAHDRVHDLSRLLPRPVDFERHTADINDSKTNDSRLQPKVTESPEEQEGSVLILTPVAGKIKAVPKYLALVKSLTYPRSKTSIAILMSNIHDEESLNNIHAMMAELNDEFKSARLFRKDYEKIVIGPERHSEWMQKERRRILAQSRNQLLLRALGSEQWVLWLDFDLIALPPNITETLIEADKPIVAPHCVYGPQNDTYDLNSYKETKDFHQWKRLTMKSDDELLLAGYADSPPGRLYMRDLRKKGIKLTELDAVGGTCLLVKGRLHRDGLIFPPYVMDNKLETEGLVAMAKKMGYQAYGLPQVIVRH